MTITRRQFMLATAFSTAVPPARAQSSLQPSKLGRFFADVVGTAII